MNIGDRFGTIGVTGEERIRNQKSSVLVRRTFKVIWKEFRSTERAFSIPSMLHSFYAKHPITGLESHSRSYLSRNKRRKIKNKKRERGGAMGPRAHEGGALPP